MMKNFLYPVKTALETMIQSIIVGVVETAYLTKLMKSAKKVICSFNDRSLIFVRYEIDISK